jgi:hypothetical protein
MVNLEGDTHDTVALHASCIDYDAYFLTGRKVARLGHGHQHRHAGIKRSGMPSVEASRMHANTEIVRSRRQGYCCEPALTIFIASWRGNEGRVQAETRNAERPVGAIAARLEHLRSERRASRHGAGQHKDSAGGQRAAQKISSRGAALSPEPRSPYLKDHSLLSSRHASLVGTTPHYVDTLRTCVTAR